MPQVRCPNCGLTINLENRKQLDINLITNAVNRRGKSFTDLLHVTKLPRKTLSLRLKELCRTGVLTKSEGVYELNGGYEKKGGGIGSLRAIPDVLSDKRVKAFFAIMLLVIGFPVASHVLAGLFAPLTPSTPDQVAQGEFTMSVRIYNVADLYAWQAVITFNPDEIEFVDVKPGSFFANEYADYPVSQTGNGFVLVGSALTGGVSGVSGSGDLATVVFRYYTANYELPRLASEDPEGAFNTLLENSNHEPIPIESPVALMLIS